MLDLTVKTGYSNNRNTVIQELKNMSKKISGDRIEVLQMKPSEASIAIRHMVNVNLRNAKLGKKRRSLFMWGGPGISKSSLVEQVCNQLNYKLIDVRLTQMEPTDLRGIPVPSDGDNGEVVVKWAVPDFFPKRSSNSRVCDLVDSITGHKYDGAIILLDELPNAPPSVQAGSYQLVLDGALGSYIVPDNVFVMAAGNRETDKGCTFRMPSPLTNRFSHIEVKVDFGDWQTHALSMGFCNNTVGYISAFPHDLYDFDPLSASRGFPTPRSWEAVSDIMYGDPNLPEQVMLGLIAGTIGDGVAIKFLEFCKMSTQLPRSEDILNGKVKILSTKETSLMYALTTSLCYELKDRNEDIKKLSGTKLKEAKKKFNQYVDNFLIFAMNNFQPEMVIMGARTALQLFKIKFEPSEMTSWETFSNKYEDIILSV